MKKLRILLAMVLLATFISGCGGKGLPLFGRAGKSTVEEASVAVPAISPETKRLYDDGDIGFDGTRFYIKVGTENGWYHQWADIFHTVLGVPSCFSDVPEAEKEAIFWVGVSQIPEDTHPNDFSGDILIPCDCREAKEWVTKVTTIIEEGRAEAWDGWAGWVARRVKEYPLYDFRVGGES